MKQNMGASSLREDRAASLRPQPPTASSQSGIPLRGTSPAFLNLTRNTELAHRSIERPWVIQRTEKRKGDVVI